MKGKTFYCKQTDQRVKQQGKSQLAKQVAQLLLCN